MAKYPKFVHDYTRLVEGSKVVLPAFEPIYGWQRNLVDYLSGQPHPRQIMWLYDPIGNTGKSYFSGHFSALDKYIITGGKNADIYYAYNYEPLVIFDLPRAKEDKVCYDVMESFKNGYFLSTKYECKPVRFNVPHVVVFANFMPEMSQLSADRWNIKQIKNAR